MIERHQDYIITVAPVPTLGIQQFPLKLDTDAPFALRLVRLPEYRALRLEVSPHPAAPTSQTRCARIGLSRFSRANRLSAREAPSLTKRWSTRRGRPSMSTSAIQHRGSDDQCAASFWGSKLFADDSYQVPVYPERMAVLPAVYQVVVPNVGANGVAGRVLNNQLTIKNDADFVYRYGACDAFVINGPSDAVPTPEQYQFTNLYVQIRDENGKYYSNAPVHVNDLFGQGLPTPFQTATANDDQVLFTPGLVTPEIYLPRKANLYFDVIRSDADGVPVNLYFRFGGMKVFQR